MSILEKKREKTSIFKFFKIDLDFFAEMQEKTQILLDILVISMYILN